MSTSNAPLYGMTIIVTGDFKNGFRAIGPFKVPSAAIDWAVTNCESNWEPVALEQPTEGGDDGNG